MNIFIISPNPIWGGAATANMAIAHMLSRKHCVYYNDEYSAISMDGVVYDNYPTHQVKDSRKLVTYLHSKSIDVVIWGVAMNIPYYRKAIRILHSQGVKQIVLFHSLAIFSSLKGRLMERLIASSLKNIDDLVFVSKYTDISWSNKYRSIRNHPNHHVIYNSIVLDNDETTGNTSFRIGYVGRFSEEKQPEVFARLSVQDDKNRYIAWGDGPLRDELARSFPNVEFKGQSLCQKEIYESIDILVMTSVFENCPMVILEAWKYGIPCVVPNVGGIPEIVKNGYNGALYDGYSTETIASCISMIQKDYNRYSANCLTDVKNYSCMRIYNNWVNVLCMKK